MTNARGRTALLTALALVAFAANSLLCRGALAPRAIDAATFTSVRLLSGALVLALLVRASGARVEGGSWKAALALFAYAIAFSFAYLRIVAGVGALILFGCVQATMIGSACLRGETLGARRWIGLLLAVGGLAWLVVPGAQAPDPIGAASMALAGVAWGAYSLFGRGSARPLASTARNFLLATPMAIGVSAVSTSAFHAEPRALVLAVLSGAVASGLGYTIWYTALRTLKASTAAIVQLAVPILAACGGAVLLGEPPNPRLLASGALVIGGVALALARRG